MYVAMLRWHGWLTTESCVRDGNDLVTRKGLPESAHGLAGVLAFEGLIGDFGDDLEVVVQGRTNQPGRVTRTADEEARAWPLLGCLVIAFLEAADHD
jgi:hypothetical protein